MKTITLFLLGACVGLMSFDNRSLQSSVEFSCVKVNKASNTCHFNFVVDGAKYRYVDIGCKFNKKRDDVIKRAKAGTLALARDWKIECEGKEAAAAPNN